MKVEHLHWDSNFFGFTVGKINIDSYEDLKRLQSTVVLGYFKVIYIFVRKAESDLLNEIEKFAIQIEEKLRFKKKIKQRDVKEVEGITAYTCPINDEMIELAWISGQHSRFRNDPNFAPYYRRLYRKWIEMSASGDMAEKIFVSHEKEKLSGFVTLSKTTGSGSIGLIAVHPDFQGKKIGTSLMKAADIWYMKNDCTQAYVSTQKSNVSACGLYRKSGYDLESSTKVFHYWKDFQ